MCRKMSRSVSFIISMLLLLLWTKSRVIEACKGCVSLDQLNFDKIVPRFGAVLVKFDVAYPYGDKHEVFSKLAEELSASQDLIFAQVGIKDYGDKENEELAKKYGIKKDDLPAIKLFTKNKQVVEFSKDRDWSLDTLRNFLRDNTNIFIGLPGCLEEFDKLAASFSKHKNSDETIQIAQDLLKNLENEVDQNSARFYIIVMEKIKENGTEFLESETKRLTKVIEAKISDIKKQELSRRINILRSFSVVRDEL